MRSPTTRNVTSIAAQFLARSFVPGETIALLIRRHSVGQTLQRIALLERILEPRYLGWLANENAAGANIHVSANPLRSQSRRRTKDSIAIVRHLYLDLDMDGEDKLASLRTSDRIPTPNAILSTSPGKYQVLWRVKGFTIEGQEAALKLLALAFGGDPACTDCNRVLRLPGFLNCKYDPAYRVTVEYPCNMTWNQEHFRLDVDRSKTMFYFRRIASQPRSGEATNSEHDWAWVLDELSRGIDAAKLTRTLAARRSDKPNPLYYAQRTVDVASARQWLMRGIAIEDVVTRLELRRRFEIPALLCSARAREIAQTAQRMIARTKPRLVWLSTQQNHDGST